MRYLRALIILGFFGWLSWGIATGALFASNRGTSGTRAFVEMVAGITRDFGATPTAAGCAVIGIALALLFLRLEARG
ncbi:hypothetical protein [Albidovulum sp.]